MRITLENLSIGKSVPIDVSDEFAIDPENITVLIGPERFKLVTTMTPEQKKRESLSQEFAAVTFAVLYNTVKDYGQPTCAMTEDDFKTYIDEHLTGRYAELRQLFDNDLDKLVRVYSPAYKQYCDYANKVTQMDNEIREASLDDDVVIDYVLQFKNVIESSKTLKEYSESSAKLFKHMSVDLRKMIGQNYITEAITPITGLIVELIHEVKSQKPSRPLTEYPLWTDPDYWSDHYETSCVPSIKALDDVLEQFNQIKTETYPESKYDYYATHIADAYGTLLKACNDLSKTIKDDNDPTAMSNARKAVKSITMTFVKTMDHLSIQHHFDQKSYSDTYRQRIIESQISYYTQMTSHLIASSEDSQKTTEFLSCITIQRKILLLVKNGSLNPELFLTKKYTDEQIKKLMNGFEDI